MKNIVEDAAAMAHFSKMLSAEISSVPDRVSEQIQDVIACSDEERENISELGDGVILTVYAFGAIGIVACAVAPILAVRKVVKKVKRR